MGEHRDMSHFDDRIRALDPFAGATYEHADAAAMVDRVTMAAPVRRRRRRLAVLAVPMTALAAAALAAGGLLATAGSPLPAASALHVVSRPQPLSLEKAAIFGTADVNGTQAQSTAWWSAANPGYALPGMPVFAPDARATYLYQLGAQLPTSSPTLPAVQALRPPDPARLLAESAPAFGLRGRVLRVDRATLVLRAEPHVAGTGLATLLTPRSGVDYLEYARGAVAPTRRCAPEPSSTVDTDQSAMSATVAQLLDTLGLRYDLARPTYETGWWRARHVACDGTVLRSATILVHGVATDQVVQAAFDPDGRLVAANLPVFTIGRATTYPLISPAVAAGALVQSTSNLGGLERHADGGVSTSTGLPNNLMIVELRTSSIGLRTFATTSGATWLLPVYALGGDGYADVAARPTSWHGDVLATATPLVRIVGRVGRVFDSYYVAP